MSPVLRKNFRGIRFCALFETPHFIKIKEIPEKIFYFFLEKPNDD
jgi:hypothetical protein